MDFQKLVDLYEELEKTSSGNALRDILSNFFKIIPPEDLPVITYLTLGKITTDSENIDLGLAEKSILKAVASAGAVELSKAQKIFQETGDVGLTAEKILQKKPQTLVPLGKLSIKEFYDKLQKLANCSGTGSQEQKSGILIALLQKASSKGAKYICRIVLGTLRLGVGDMTVIDALSIAFTGEKSNKELLERAYNICPDVGIIAETIAKKGLKGLEKIDVHVGRPIKVMLAQRVEELEEVPKKMPGSWAVEAKYDGERVQAHKNSKGKYFLFSRRMENITLQFPDLVKHLEESIKAKEFVVEGEILALDEKCRPLPFQVLMQRRRKYDIAEYSKKIPIVLKIFDLLYLNGSSLMSDSYEKRTAQLQKIIHKEQDINLADKIITEDIEEVNIFFRKMLALGYEGIIIKSLTGEYQAGTRGWNWIKWKKDYVQEMTDTLDLVIVGAYHGQGKRSGTYGALLCACYNEKEDSFETVCKLGTGLTDELLEELPKKLKKYQLNHKPARLNIKKEMEPDIWFEPAIVVEVLGAELTKSPFHSAGLALRFPRFVRFREKKAEQATTKKEIEQMAKK